MNRSATLSMQGDDLTVTLRDECDDQTSKWGNSASFKLLDFWPTRGCLTITQQSQGTASGRVGIVFRWGYKGWKKFWLKII